MCLGLGWCLRYGGPLAWTCLAGFTAVVVGVHVPAKEQALQARFGSAYRDYTYRVGRWGSLPGPHRAWPASGAVGVES